ncbi:MAG TPA: hypothetical protein VNK04_13305 [Gemmataceae bacterium]|nr:hypothetical protein [Gemmataceae bacterium]
MSIPSRSSLLVLSFVLAAGPSPWAEEPLRLVEQFPVGYQYHVSSRVELSGSVLLPPEKDGAAPRPLKVSGESAIEYDERVLALDAAGQPQKTVRIYRRLDFRRRVGDQPQENTLRPAVRRLVLLRRQNVEVPFSPDGPLTWNEIDLVRTDVFTPALAGLLPGRPVRPGERWTAAAAAVQELTDLERTDEGSIACRLEQVTTLENRRHARVALAGTVRGTNEDGPNRQQLEGYYFFDLESNHLSYLYVKGVNSMLDKDGKEVGRLEGHFVLTRQAHRRSPDLSDAALRGVALEPDADNTLLLFDSPEAGVRFLYPRRWRASLLPGRRVTLDGADGSGLLLTVEPLAKVPTGAGFLAESRAWMKEQKAKELRVVPPQRLQAAPQELEHFALEVEVSGQRVLMDYYVVRQPSGGATLAARLLPADLAALRKEVERIARSVTITGTIK